MRTLVQSDDGGAAARRSAARRMSVRALLPMAAAGLALGVSHPVLGDQGHAADHPAPPGLVQLLTAVHGQGLLQRSEDGTEHSAVTRNLSPAVAASGGGITPSVVGLGAFAPLPQLGSGPLPGIVLLTQSSGRPHSESEPDRPSRTPSLAAPTGTTTTTGTTTRLRTVLTPLAPRASTPSGPGGAPAQAQGHPAVPALQPPTLLLIPPAALPAPSLIRPTVGSSLGSAPLVAGTMGLLLLGTLIGLRFVRRQG